MNLEELDRVLDGAREAPLSEADHDKLKDALHALAAMLVRPRNTEKTSAVVEKPEDCGIRNTAGQQYATAARARPQWSRGVWWCAEGGHQAPEVDARRPLSGVRKRQRLRAEGAEGAGADRRSGAAGGYGLLARTVALRRLRAGVHGAGAGRSGAG